MTEDEARAWMGRHFGQAAVDRVAMLVDLLVAENLVQNLVSPASIPSIWSRHVVDSAQLLALAPGGWRRWLDIGTGGGFPGMVMALLVPDRAVTMVEPRRKRADFLQACVDHFALRNAIVLACKVEAVTARADIISARAVASVDQLLRLAASCADVDTTWLFPRGRSGEEIVEAGSWMFHVEHSVTDEESRILVGRGHQR